MITEYNSDFYILNYFSIYSNLIDLIQSCLGIFNDFLCNDYLYLHILLVDVYELLSDQPFPFFCVEKSVKHMAHLNICLWGLGKLTSLEGSDRSD
jgi:hypothetical protein